MDLPRAPEIGEERWQEARKTGEYEYIAFEEYKFIGQMTALIAGIQRNSPAFQEISTQHFNVLIGLLNRCARLMLATLDLSHKGKFGETSAIIFRCIVETGLKITWLCVDSSQEKFDRYIGDGLKPELELRESIDKNIQDRGGEELPIEKRMRESINKHIATAQITEEQIREAKKVPDVASLLTSLGFPRLVYVALYRMGSHHVHGTWPSLLFHYLDESDVLDVFEPRGNNASTRANEYVAVSLIIIKALDAYASRTLDAQTYTTFNNLLNASEAENFRIFEDMTKHGF